jgi:hypothetical protein
VKRDLGGILAHGEPESGMGQGEAAEQPPEELAPASVEVGEAGKTRDRGREDGAAKENGPVLLDFSGVGPEAP